MMKSEATVGLPKGWGAVRKQKEGRMVKWFNTAVCKTAIRGFESHSGLHGIRVKKQHSHV